MNLQEILKNKKEAIRLKKAALKKCDNIIVAPETQIQLKGEAHKNDDTDDAIYRTIVGNTYGFMDSHDDVHIKGIFTKSIKENGPRVLHLHDHVHQLSAKVGSPQRVYESVIKWSDVGLNTKGETTALLMDSKIEKARNTNIFNDYKSGEIDQHSVGMQYVKLELAVNDPEEKEEFAVWEKYKDEVINIEKAEERGFFWAVTEAKLIEISCVIRGSNELTPTLEAKEYYDLEGLEQMSEKVAESPTKENILHFCETVKALRNGEPVEPLPEKKKPSYFEIMAKAETKRK